MSKSRFIELMSKSIDKSASEEELRELELFLKNSPSYRKLDQVANALETKLQRTASGLSAQDVDNGLSELWVKIKGNGNSPESNVFSINRFFSLHKWRWTVSAAAVILITSFGTLLYYQHNSNKLRSNISMVNINVPFGKQIELTLPDSSKVKLNAGSHFSYPSEFPGKTRDVNLEGEGFFEVAKNAAKPFLVHTQNLTIKVLGTIFNVKAYKDDKKVETTLLKGKILIEIKNDPEQKIVLLPHEKLTVNDTHQVLNSGKLNSKEIDKVKYQLTAFQGTAGDEYQENAWINHEIIFTNDDFEDVAKQLERKYDVHIIFKDEALKRERLSGVLKNESIEDALRLLKQIIAFTYKMNDRNIYLSAR